MALTPSRLADTSTGIGRVAGHRALSVAVLGHAGVPHTGVAAVAVNVTAAGPAQDGDLIVYRHEATRPALPTVSFQTAHTTTQSTIAAVGRTGTIDVYNASNGQTGVVVDVTGYFRSGPTAPGGFVPAGPADAVGSRAGALHRRIAGGATIALNLSARNGKPGGAAAALVSVTALHPRGAGSVSLSAHGSQHPSAALPFAAHETTTAAMPVGLGAHGAVSLHNGSTHSIDVIVGVVGYFASAPAGTPGSYTASWPDRRATRVTGGAETSHSVSAGGHWRVPVRGRGGVPKAGVSAVMLGVTAVHPTRSGGIAGGAADVADSALVTSLWRGRTTSNTSIMRIGARGSVQLTNTTAATVRLQVRILGYFTAADQYASASGGPGNTQANVTERLVTPANAARLQPAWSSSAKQDAESPPTIRDGVAYVDIHVPGESHPRLAALDVRNGSTLWSTAMSMCGNPNASVAVLGDLLFDTCQSPAVVNAIDLRSHEVIWTRQVGSVQVYNTTVATDGVVLVRSDSGAVIGLEPDSGQVRYSIPPPPFGRIDSFTAADGLVVVAGEETKVYDARTGALRWGALGAFGGNVEIDSGHIVATGFFGRIAEWPESGCGRSRCAPSWVVDIPPDRSADQQCLTQPGAADGTAIVITHDCSSSAELLLLDEDTGAVRRTFVIPDDRVVATKGATRSGNLLWIPAGGDEVAFDISCVRECAPVVVLPDEGASGHPSASISVADGTVFVQRWIADPELTAYRLPG